MALFKVGDVAYAGCVIQTDARGDHPAFLHARHGDKLYVLEHRPGKEFAYVLSAREDGSEPFSAKATELMKQKPFPHNR